MSEKVSVNIMVPGLNTSHNYLIPDDMSVSKVYELVITTLKDEYPEASVQKLSFHGILQGSTGKMLNNASDLSHLGILDGEKLILL